MAGSLPSPESSHAQQEKFLQGVSPMQNILATMLQEAPRMPEPIYCRQRFHLAPHVRRAPSVALPRALAADRHPARHSGLLCSAGIVHADRHGHLGCPAPRLAWVKFDDYLARTRGKAEWTPATSPSALIARASFWVCVLLGLIIGVSAFDASYATAATLPISLLPYLTHAVGAIFLLIAGNLIARFLARSVLIGAVNAQLQYARFLSLGVKWLVLVLTAAMVLDHLESAALWCLGLRHSLRRHRAHAGAGRRPGLARPGQPLARKPRRADRGARRRSTQRPNYQSRRRHPPFLIPSPASLAIFKRAGSSQPPLSVWRARPTALAERRRLSDNGRMTDLERILSLWRELEIAGADYVLATVVAVEGPSYRKPGALMLLTADGRRIGTVSGGCLEAQVASRAWWLTANGPTIQRYSTAEDDGDRPYGSGCGGVVFLLLERRATAGRCWPR
jgi:hypothetical protein